MIDRKPLRVGVLGTGNWGRVHIEAYWRNPDTDLVAICGMTNQKRVEWMGQQYSATPYLDLGEMMRRKIWICSASLLRTISTIPRINRRSKRRSTAFWKSHWHWMSTKLANW